MLIVAETIQVPADAAIALLVASSKMTQRDLGKKIGRTDSFISAYAPTGRMPNLSLFCEIANACDFDVVLVRGNEQVVVTPSECSA